MRLAVLIFPRRNLHYKHTHTHIKYVENEGEFFPPVEDTKTGFVCLLQES